MPRFALVLVLVMLATPLLVSAFSCPKCGTFECAPATDCKHGVGKDACNCCDRCLMGEAEVCGGAYRGYADKCAEGFECVFPALEGAAKYNSDGVCTKKAVIPA